MSVQQNRSQFVLKEKQQSAVIYTISAKVDENLTIVEIPVVDDIPKTRITPHGKNGGVKTLSRKSERTDLPELTIPNLLAEIYGAQNEALLDVVGEI